MPMVYVRALSEPERQALRQEARRAVGRVAERIRMILLSSRGYSVPEIARIFECEEATVREWIRRFEAEGLPGLKDRPRRGRPLCADAAAQERLRRTVQAGPQSAGYSGGTWTVLLLQIHLIAAEGVVLSCATVRRLLLRLDFRWRRPKLVLPQDPAAAAKMQHILERVLHAPADAVLLCLDECDIHLLPVLRAMWMPRGEQAQVPTPGSNRKRGLFGALAPESGRWHYRVVQKKTALEFLAFLEELLRAYPSEPLLLVLDNASIHTAKVVQAWLGAHPSVELLFLPSYAGHRENPVEKVWWRLKQQIAGNRLYDDVDALIAAVRQFFDSFTPEAALRLAA
jgi:transposase